MSGPFGSNWLDLSNTSNRYIQTYVRGFLDVSGGNVIIRNNNNLFMESGDASLNGRLLVGNDASFNSRLFVGGDSSMNGNLSIGKDVTIAGKLSVKQYTSQVMITTVSYGFLVAEDMSLNGRLFVINDASLSSRLFVASDVSMGGKLYVAGDVSMGGNLYAATQSSSDNSNKVATTSFVQTLVSSIPGGGGGTTSSSNYFSTDVSMAARLFVTSDLSMGGNAQIYGNGTVYGLLSANNGLTVNYGSVTLPATSINDAALSTNIATLTGNQTFTNKTINAANNSISGLTNTNLSSTAGITNSQLANSNVTIGTTSISLGSTSTTLAGLDNISSTDASLNSRLFVGGDASLNSRLFLLGDLSMGGNISTGKDVTIGGKLFVKQYTSQIMITTVSYGLMVAEDMSLNGRLFVLSDSSFSGDVYVGGNLIAQTPASNDNSTKVATTEFVQTAVSSVSGGGGGGGGTSSGYFSTDVSMNQRLFVVGDISLGGNLIASGNVQALSFRATSDYRIKNDIRPLNDRFTVDNLRPVHYYNTHLNKEEIGFIAHEIQEIYPFLVHGDKDGPEMQSLNYIGLLGVLTKEIKDLKKENITLKQQVSNVLERLSKSGF